MTIRARVVSLVVGLLAVHTIAGGGIASSPPAPADAPATRRYWFGFLSRGPGWTPQRNAHTDSVQAAHMENIGRMFEAGALVCAGPFLDNTSLRGIFIFSGDSATAAGFAARDQAILEKRLQLELRPWNGPDGISEAYRALRARPGHRDSMVRFQMALLKKGAAGSAPPGDSLPALRQAHARHVAALMRTGALQAAGAFTDGRDPGEVLIFRTDSAGTARALATDPLVQRGWLTIEQHPWMTADGILPAPGAATGR